MDNLNVNVFVDYKNPISLVYYSLMSFFGISVSAGLDFAFDGNTIPMIGGGNISDTKPKLMMTMNTSGSASGAGNGGGSGSATNSGSASGNTPGTERIVPGVGYTDEVPFRERFNKTELITQRDRLSREMDKTDKGISEKDVFLRVVRNKFPDDEVYKREMELIANKSKNTLGREYNHSMDQIKQIDQDMIKLGYQPDHPVEYLPYKKTDYNER